jgi:hypothetical protein
MSTAALMGMMTAKTGILCIARFLQITKRLQEMLQSVWSYTITLEG